MTPEFRPKCIWCNAPWTDDNIRVEEVYAGGGCDTCGYGTIVSGTINIVCHVCNKLMYQKEFVK